MCGLNLTYGTTWSMSFNYALEEWWQDVYQELWDEAKCELLDSGDYYEEKED